MVTTSIYSLQDTLLKINFLDVPIISYYYNNVNKNSLSNMRVIGICYREVYTGRFREIPGQDWSFSAGIRFSN